MKRRTVLALLGGMVLAASYAALFLVYPRLPRRVPMHWNAAGGVDGLMGKEWLFLAMALPAVAPLLVVLAARLDPHRGSHEVHARTFGFLLASLFVLFLVIAWISILYPLGLLGGDPGTPIFLLIGASFVAMGNVIPRLQHNFTMGIRLPWTIASEKVWKKTHRVGGFLMVAAGAAILIAAFLAPAARAVAMTGSILGFVGLTAAYSYWTYRKEEKEKSK